MYMKFCSECGSMMKSEEDDYWICGSCGHEDGEPSRNKRESERKKTIHRSCPECGTELKTEFTDSQGPNTASRKLGSGNPNKKRVCPNCGFNK